jgi:putative ABC transport system permease protein
METFAMDLRYAFRWLAARRGFTLAVVLLLALGIGANGAVFSVANSLLLRPLPLREAERLVFPVAMYRQDRSPVQVSTPEVMAWKQATSFESLGAAQIQGFNLAGDGEPEHVEGASITPDYLTTLGVQPLLGRALRAEDARSAEPSAGAGSGPLRGVRPRIDSCPVPGQSPFQKWAAGRS